MANKGTLRLMFQSTNNIPINEMRLIINQLLTKPDKKNEYVGFLPYFQTVEKPTLEVNKSSIVYEGFLIPNKSYDFELDEGDYYGSINNNDLESSYTLKRIRPFLYNDSINLFTTIGYKSSLVHPSALEDIKFTDFIRESCQTYDGKKNDYHWACPKISIKENKITQLSINVSGREISFSKTFFSWIPGLIFLVPIFNGSIVYDRNISVSLSLLTNQKKVVK